MVFSRPYFVVLALCLSCCFCFSGCKEPVPKPSLPDNPSFEETLAQLKAYQRSNLDSAGQYELALNEMLPQLGQEDQLEAFSAMGQAAYAAGRYDAALRYFEQGAAIAGELGLISQQAKLISRQGNTMTMQGKLEAALELQEEALRLSKTLSEPGSERAFILQGLAYAYQKGNEPARGIPYLEEALDYYKSIESWRGTAYTMNLLQTAWSEIDSLDKAQSLLEEVLQPPIAPHLNTVDSGIMLNNLGRIYNMKGQYQKAITVLDQAILVKSTLDNPDSYAKSIVEQMTSLKQAERWADCIALADEIAPGDFEQLSIYTRRDWYKELSTCYAGEGLMEAAFETRLRYETLYDSVYNAQNQENIKEVELRLAREEQARLEQAERIARQQRNLILAASVIIGLTGFFLFLLWRARQRRESAILAIKAEELEKNDALRLQLFTNISHELRTPLTFITAALQQIMDNPGQNSGMWLNSLQNGTQQLQRLVNQILDLSRLDAGKLTLNKTVLNGFSFFRGITNNWRPAAHSKNIEYQVNLQIPEQAAIFMDARKTEQILNNLLSNAVKFTPAGGQINCTIALEGNALQISVADSGPGVPAEQLPHIFERFYTAPNPVNHNIGGAGIGLSFASELVKLMKGSLEVESEVGKGTTFYCQLPVEFRALSQTLPTQTQEKPAPVPDSYKLNASPKATLLIVEDNPGMQQLLQQILAPSYRVIPVFDGEEALKVLEGSDKIDLIISDMMMPGMNGQQLLQRLKSTEKWLDIPVVMLTARADEQDKLRALSVGVDDYLTKPFSPPELLARIFNLLKFRTLRQLKENGAVIIEGQGMSPADLSWLKAVEAQVLSGIRNSNFSVVQLAQKLHLSERQLHRRIKSITGMTPNRYFWELRLHQARQMLESGSKRTVAEVSYAVGVDTPEYFSKKYKERFGKKPVDYLNN